MISRSIHKDHVLSCSASQLECGGFRAHVAIICMRGDKTRSQRFLDLKVVFATEAEAREKGASAGIEWIEANALIEESKLYPARFLKHR